MILLAFARQSLDEKYCLYYLLCVLHLHLVGLTSLQILHWVTLYKVGSQFFVVLKAYDARSFDEGSFDEGIFVETSFDERSFDEGSFDEGIFDETLATKASFDESRFRRTTSFDRTSFDEGSFDEGIFDEGQFFLLSLPNLT